MSALLRQFLTLSVFLLLPCIILGANVPEFLGVIRADTVGARFGERIVPLGDQNNDGYDDFLTSRGNGVLQLFYGAAAVDTVPQMRFNQLINRPSSIGDITNDNKDEFSVFSLSTSRLEVFFGGQLIDTLSDLSFGTSSQYGLGFTVTGDDINSNGSNELISWSGLDQRSVLLWELWPDGDSMPDLVIPSLDSIASDVWSFGRNIIAGDFNGDGKRDIAVSHIPAAPLQKNGSVYLYWGGASFDTIPDLIIKRPGAWFDGANSFGNVLESLGDITADGYDDFICGTGGAASDTLHFIYFGGPAIDTIPDVAIARRFYVARSAGDVNNDGYNDLIMGYPDEGGITGKVQIYLGGPDVDSIADVVILRNDLPFQYDRHLGMEVAGIGDYNGDGIDDFAFALAEEWTHWAILIYSGWDGGTDVQIVDDGILPESFILSQNYPNPFNLGTTIEFSLPKRSYIMLAIYNVLGERVKTLVDRSLSVGTYTAQWDGTDESDRVVSSGVYIYRLETGDHQFSRKMVLLK